MHRNEDEDRTTGGLSTEDLAQPATTGADAEQATSGAPVYPGESTPTTGAGGESATGGADAEVAAPEAPAEGAATEAPAEAAATEAPAAEGAPGTTDDEVPQLLTDDEERGFRDRWQQTQNKFVDDPREAVHDADTLVADVMQALASTFAQHKRDLEAQWSHGERVDTEELRGALRRYRSFFNRLLST